MTRSSHPRRGIDTRHRTEETPLEATHDTTTMTTTLHTVTDSDTAVVSTLTHRTTDQVRRRQQINVDVMSRPLTITAMLGGEVDVR